MKLYHVVNRSNESQALGPVYFQWTKNGKQVAHIAIYPDGLVEFQGSGNSVSIECIGTKQECVTHGE